MASVQILDIYSGNKFDAEAEKATGVDGVIIKAGQGQNSGYLRDAYPHIAACARVGLPIGFYWLVDARYSPESHKAAIKAAFPAGDFGPLGLWLDVEKPALWMTDFVYRALPYAYYKPVESVWRGVHAYTGKYPGIYTSPGAWNLIMSAMPVTLQQEFAAKCDLWLAHYGVAVPRLVGAWTKYTMWQYQGEPDYSIFNGSEEEFASRLGSAPKPPEPARVLASVNVDARHGRVVLTYTDGTQESRP